MTPLSIVFRVDAQDDADAVRQLTEVVATADRIRAAITPAPAADVEQFQAALTAQREAFAAMEATMHEPRPEPEESSWTHTAPDGRRVERPWAPGQDGMGQ